MSGKNNKKPMPFAPMISIIKKPSLREERCSDWVATEKIHGASFQFFTNDGKTIHMGSRTRCLDGQASFQKCNLAGYLERYSDYVKKVYAEVTSSEKWKHYREKMMLEDDTGDDSDCEDMAARRDRDLELGDPTNGEAKAPGKDIAEGDGSGDENNLQIALVEVRVYGELYGGGGVERDTKSAIQKEIIYSDEHRFYVFGITVNKRWLNVAELNDICKMALFPYYAVPVCEPKATLEELQETLISSGFMSSTSQFTDREDGFHTKIEGVVMSPLTRPDYRHHAIKMLSAAFNDIRVSQKDSKLKQVNYCTKARYMSVISKLDIPERLDTEMVTRLFLQDIEKESNEILSINKRKGCVKAVRKWLMDDGYLEDEYSKINKNTTQPSANETPAQRDSDTEDGGFDSLFGEG